MNTLIVFTCFLATALAQRPSFAGTRVIGVPGLHPSFKKNEPEDSLFTTPAIASRFGGGDGTTLKIPVDARGDVNLVNRLNTWPEENRPFWLKNYEIIESQRGRPGGRVSSQRVNPTVTTRRGDEANEIIKNRFAETDDQPIVNKNSFTILINGKFRTYVYNSSTDSWIRKI